MVKRKEVNGEADELVWCKESSKTDESTVGWNV
jgi:hypothetical protein